MRDTKDFNERFLRWKNGENYWEMRGVSLNTNSDRPATKELVELIKSRLAKFLDGKDNFEPFYLLKMKEVGEQNYRVWGFNTPQEATRAALSDPTYDYRGFYEKYPESSANSNTHWTDEFKTAHHPTFSTESKYSGNKNKFNPQGLRGGFWNGDDFIPATWLEPKILNKRRKIMGYADGKDVQYTRQNGNPIAFDELGNLIDQVTGLTGVMLDEVFNRMAVTPQGVTFNGVVPNSSVEQPKKQTYLEPTDLLALANPVLNRLSPTLNIRAIYDTFDPSSTWQDKLNSWFIGNAGITSNKFQLEHPWLSTGINLVGDAGFYTAPYMSNVAKNTNLYKNAKLSVAMRNAIDDTNLLTSFEDPSPRIRYIANQDLHRNLNWFDAKSKIRLVDKDGNVNMRNVANLVRQIYNNYPLARPYKKILNSSGNLYEHTKAVVKSAQEMELPKGVTRQELVESALIHDFGKILNGSVTHDTTTGQIAKDLGFVKRGLINQSAVDAASIHMSPGIAGESNLARGLHFADVARGLDLFEVLDKNPHLAYPTDAPLVSPNLPKDTKWLLLHIINPLIDKYGYELTKAERKELGLPTYVEGDPQIPLDVDEQTARKAVLQILKKHRTFERTSHYPTNDKSKRNLIDQAASTLHKPANQISDLDMFDISSQYVKKHKTNSGTVGLDNYLHKSQLDSDEHEAIYTSTRDVTAAHYMRENTGLPYRADFVLMDVNDNPDWSLAELWANNEFPIVLSDGRNAPLNLSTFRKYELPYILHTGRSDYAERVAEISKKHFRDAYILAPNMKGYSRPISDQPKKVLLIKRNSTEEPEVYKKRIDDAALDISDMLTPLGIKPVSPKTITTDDGILRAISIDKYFQLTSDLYTAYGNFLNIESLLASGKLLPFHIDNFLHELRGNGLISDKQFRAAMLDMNRHRLVARKPLLGSLPSVPPSGWDNLFDDVASESFTFSVDYNPFKYISKRNVAKTAINKYYKSIKEDNSKNAYFKKRKADAIVKNIASKELFKNLGINPNFSLESPDGYRVFTTERDGFRLFPDADFEGGSHYVVVGKRGSKQLNIVGKYEPTLEELQKILYGGSHGGKQRGSLRQLSRNFGGFAPPVFAIYEYLKLNNLDRDYENTRVPKKKIAKRK